MRDDRWEEKQLPLGKLCFGEGDGFHWQNKLCPSYGGQKIIDAVFISLGSMGVARECFEKAEGLNL